MRNGQLICKHDEEKIGFTDQPKAWVSPLGNYWVCSLHREKERLAKIRLIQ